MFAPGRKPAQEGACRSRFRGISACPRRWSAGLPPGRRLRAGGWHGSFWVRFQSRRAGFRRGATAYSAERGRRSDQHRHCEARPKAVQSSQRRVYDAACFTSADYINRPMPASGFILHLEDYSDAAIVLGSCKTCCWCVLLPLADMRAATSVAQERNQREALLCKSITNRINSP